MGQRRLAFEPLFDNTGRMESKTAVRALGALAHESRLSVFRLLVRANPDGMPAGELAERVGLPASTLSFHLQHLLHAGLIRSERRGRSLIYSLCSNALRELTWFLGEDCCQGRSELFASPTSRIDKRLREAEQAERPAVLFLCSANSARSQMAEALLRRAAGERIDVHSGGLRPQEIHPLTLRVLAESGIETRELYSKDLGHFLGKLPIHYAITVCELANRDCPRVHPFSMHQLYWPFPDPAAAMGTEAERLAVFRSVRDAIEVRIHDWLRAEFPAHPQAPAAAGNGQTR